MSQSVSLIIPLAARETPSREMISGLKDSLLAVPGISRVETIVAGGRSAEPGPVIDQLEWIPVVEVDHSNRDGRITALRSGIAAATGDILLVMDPRRSYEPTAAAAVIGGLNQAAADLAIAVPERGSAGSVAQRLTRRLVGLTGSATLGTADVVSGLMAIRRKGLAGAPASHHARGSMLALDLLAWPCEIHCDVPVATATGDRLSLLPLRFDDVRQLKRVLDRRFGTFSRLVQFCMVGASGMVIDLTLYALLQLMLGLAASRSVAILTALVWNFSLNRRLTFNDARGGSILRQFATYALGNALGIAVNFSMSLYLPRQFAFFDQHRLAAAVVGIVVATGISFSMSRWVVFIRKAPSPVAPLRDAEPLTPQPARGEQVAVS